MKDEPIDPPNKEPATGRANEDVGKDSGVEFVVPVKNHQIASEDEVDIQVRLSLLSHCQEQLQSSYLHVNLIG